VDDWLHLLNAGRSVTAVANSDSHDLAAEVGNPRTYFWVAPFSDGTPRDGAPAAVTDLDLVDAVQSRRAIATNGPFLDLYVVTADAADPEKRISWPMGSAVRYGASNVGREVEVLLVLRTAPWIDVDEILVYANGRVIDTLEVPPGNRSDGVAIDDDNTFRRTYAFDRDVVLVAEVSGATSMFPMYTPKEEPPTNIGDALGGITSGLGLEGTFGGGDNVVAPDYVQTVTPWAITNPIWLDIDASGRWEAPGNDSGPGPAPTPAPDQCPESGEMRSQTALQRGLLDLDREPRHYGRTDIRQIFHARTSP
jgi:hypothetical protein